MLAVLWAFELERGVRDGEVVARAFAQLVDDAVARGAVGLVCDGDVRGDGHEVRGHGGHVQVVHVEHARRRPACARAAWPRPQWRVPAP